MDSINALKGYKGIIDRHLYDFFSERKKELAAAAPFSQYMLELIEDFTMRGGKRVRPALMYHGYALFSSYNLDEVIRGSMAFELIQTYLLIHDDIIDQDDLRRGFPTMHRMFQDVSKDSHFGSSMALLAGDMANHLANMILLSLKMPAARKLKAASEFNRFINRVIHGEALDVLSGFRNRISEEHLLDIHRLKTAAYTFEAPLVIGAILAGASPSSLKALNRYAIPLGQAFQLQDDILGMFGDEKKLGKPVGSDLKEGKKTLLIIKALEKASPKDKKTIRRALGNSKLSKKDIEAVRKIIVDTGSLDYSRELAKKLVAEAKAAISHIRNSPSREFLIGIADYIMNREY